MDATVIGAGAGAAVDTLFLVGQDATGIRRVDYRMVDGRPGSDLHFEGVIVPVEATIEIRDLVALARDVGIAAACAEAIAHNVHSADVVLNILARQRDPDPPATIHTPAALTLRHAPVADCARYDNLRSMI